MPSVLSFASGILPRGGHTVFCRDVATSCLVAVLGTAFSHYAVAQFETRATFSTQTNPYSLAVGDFNGDGVLDLAAVNGLPTGSIQILMGNGDGTFRSGDTYSVAVFPTAVVTASLRNNGILDLVINDKLSDDVWVMLGNGDGTFRSAVAYPTTAESYTVAVGDFTGDGKIDVIALEQHGTGGQSCSCVEVLPGRGDGTFGAPVTTVLPHGIGGYAMTSGDFNDDGKLDVAVVGETFPVYNAVILLGNGQDGAFAVDGSYLVSSLPGSIAAGNFTNSQRKLDLAVTNDTGASLSILLGYGDAGNFSQVTCITHRITLAR